MANLVHLEARSTNWEAALSTGLNALAAAASASSSAFANGTDLYPFMDVSIILASLTPDTGGFVEIHVVPLMDDGTSYPDIFAGGPTLVGSVGLSSGTGAKKGTLIQVGLPDGDFKLALLNKAGASVALGGTLNTVKIRRYGLNDNA